MQEDSKNEISLSNLIFLKQHFDTKYSKFLSSSLSYPRIILKKRLLILVK